MRSILIGAGQVGGIIGGRVVRAGHDLILCDADREHVQAIRVAGLLVDLPNDSFTVKPQILFPSEVSGLFDLVMIAVRSEATKDVLDAMVKHITDDAVVVSLQNGMNLPMVADRVGADRAVGAVVRMRSIKIAPGHVRTYQNGYLYIGHIHGRPTARLNALHAFLDPVIPTKIADNMYGVMWSKLTFTSMRMLSWIADAKMPAIWESEANRRLFAEFITEVVRVGEAAGARLEKLAEYDPNDFHPSRSLTERMATIEQMARELEGRKGDWRRFEAGRGDRSGWHHRQRHSRRRAVGRGDAAVPGGAESVLGNRASPKAASVMQNYRELYPTC